MRTWRSHSTWREGERARWGCLMENMLGCGSSPCAVSLADMTSRMASQMLPGQILQQTAGTLRGAVPVLLRNACEEV